MVQQEARHRCLYIIGAQSTGKTTLVNGLEKDFHEKSTEPEQRIVTAPTIIREVARTVLKEKNFTRDDIKSSPNRALQLQKFILDAQLGSEKAASEWYISDRSGLDPIVYAHVFVSEKAARNMLATDAWKELKQRMKAGVVILCEAGCSWLVDDGTRMIPDGMEQWMEIDGIFRQLLDSQGISYSVVSKDMGDLTERVHFVQEQLRKAM